LKEEVKGEVSKIPKKETVEIKKKGISRNARYGVAIVILAILAFILAIYLYTPETRSVPYQESYQDPVYRTEDYQDPVYRAEDYQDPVYKIEYYQEPVYTTESYQDPVYITETYTYNCGFLGLKTCSGQRQVIGHYDTKSRQVLDHYETKSRQVIDHYETKSRQVFDHNELKERQVFDHNELKYRTKYNDVTRRRYQWIIMSING
jgi:hypothetical protein